MEKSKHVVMRTVFRKDGSKGVEVWTPEKVTQCPSKEELEAKLKHYSKLLFSLHTPDSEDARRKYVELVRPALRYYCKRFGVKVPQWLATDTYYTQHMSDDERHKQFGTKPLRIKEFTSLRGRKSKAAGAKKKGSQPSA